MFASRSHYASALRREIVALNNSYAALNHLPHVTSYGELPVVVYQQSECGQHHGNFISASYRAILRRAEWRKRLQKVHSQGRRSLPARDGLWRELDSSLSSDALLMNTLRHHKNTLRAYVLPKFGERKITEINREDVQTFLAEKAPKYSESTLRSMRVVLGLTLGWANNCGWLEKNPCTRVKLPKRTGGKRVTRTVLTSEQVNAIAEKLKEPYATLVLFLATSGLRIGEALAIKWTDFKNNVLHVTRRIYEGDVDAVKSKRSDRKLPIDPILMARIEKLGKGEWVFRSKTGGPLNPGNALKRHVRPAAEELGISLGGWHDFRHTLSTKLRRSGVHPKVVSDILGHNKVNLAMDVYDRTEASPPD